MSKHCEVLLSFGPIDFYNDSGWATLTYPETHDQNIESWWFFFFFYNVLDTRVVWKAFMHLPYITGDFTTKLYKKKRLSKNKAFDLVYL